MAEKNPKTNKNPTAYPCNVHIYIQTPPQAPFEHKKGLDDSLLMPTVKSSPAQQNVLH